jgi:GT2 family glycosyltransferase
VARSNHAGRYTALVLTEDGEHHAIAKIATDELGREKLTCEARALAGLANRLEPPLQAPGVLAKHRGLLLLEAADWQPRGRPWRLPPAVARSLGSLFAAGMTEAGDTRGFSHGDFAPWNLLREDDTWTLVDWEQGQKAPPFRDVLHYLVQAHVHLGRPSRRRILAGLRGEGWVGRALRAYAEGAHLDVSHARRHLAAYLAERLAMPPESAEEAVERQRLRGLFESLKRSSARSARALRDLDALKRRRRVARAPFSSLGRRPSLRADAIVVAYRSEEVMEPCVRSLRSDPAVDRIIVVNNNPGDGTAAAVAGCPGVVYLDSRENVGFGRAVNRAREYVRSDFVVVANPDTVQEESTPSQLLDFLAGHPCAGLAAPRMVYADGRLYRNSKREVSLVRMMFEALGGPHALQISHPERRHRTAHRTGYVIAAFIAARVEALDSIGWFDESIFLFGEDQDLCRRLRQQGWEVWLAPVGRVMHLSGHSRRQIPAESRRLLRAARYRDFKASGKRLQAESYRGLVALREHIRRTGVASRASSGVPRRP